MLTPTSWLALACAALLAVGACKRPAAAATCVDGVRNGEESDVDCGGSSCAPCAVALACALPEDCATQACAAHRCTGASCQDGRRTGEESDVDCGGPCSACPAGKACKAPADCASGACDGGTCGPASCTDLRRNGLETDVDCGGPACPACGLDAGCGKNADCAVGACRDGKCGGRCSAPTLECGEACVDPRFDPFHCGGCNQPCAPGLFCTNGVCAQTCGGGTSACGPECVDLARDVLHCGQCGTACQPGEQCAGGACDGGACSPGQTLCAGTCVRLATDVEHCGMCDTPCAPGEYCSLGQCASNCAPPLERCDGGVACVAPLADPDNCGGCGIVCPAVLNAPRLCLFGTCSRAACAPTFADCNRLPVDGCEATLTTDNANCGRCGTVCPGVQNCDGGACQ